MLRHWCWSGVVNLLLGFSLIFVIGPWFMTVMYVGDAFGWIVDPTLDEGLLLPFLLLALAASGIYLPALVLANTSLRRKLDASRVRYFLFAAGMNVLGLVALPVWRVLL